MPSVAHICTFFSELGGVERSVRELATAQTDGDEVTVLCTKRGPGTSTQRYGRITVTAVGASLAVAGRPLSFGFPRELARLDADVLHYHMPFPLGQLSHLLVRPKARVVVATWHHDLVRHRFFRNVFRPVTEAFLDALDAIIVPAPPLLETVPALARRKEKCHVIPLGVDETRLGKQSGAQIEECRRRYGSPMVLFVGRLVYYKGCDVLIAAMRDVPAHLVVVGAGPLAGQLQEAARAAGLAQRVHFLGWQPEQELARLYQACDILVLPSTLPTECFGLTQVEAMICGKPVVNTALPTGVPWVSLHQQTGLTVAPGDVEALAKAIRSLLSDEKMRRTLGEQARRRAMTTFTLAQQVDATSQLYQRLLNAASSCRS